MRNEMSGLGMPDFPPMGMANLRGSSTAGPLVSAGFSLEVSWESMFPLLYNSFLGEGRIEWISREDTANGNWTSGRVTTSWCRGRGAQVSFQLCAWCVLSTQRNCIIEHIELNLQALQGKVRALFPEEAEQSHPGELPYFSCTSESGERVYLRAGDTGAPIAFYLSRDSDSVAPSRSFLQPSQPIGLC